MKGIYFDNASTSWPKAPGVASEMAGYLENIGCNVGRGSYGRAYVVSRKVYETREKLRCLFDAEDNKNVIFTANVTQAINTVLKGFLRRGDHVLISGLEHNAVVRPLEHLKQTGVTYDVIPCDNLGNLEVTCIEKMIKPETRAVVMTHGSNVSGNILPVEAVGRICTSRGLYFIVDTAQTAGLHDISMKKANISALCFTGHKGLMGPQGTGGICVKEGIEIRPFKVGGSGVQSYSRTHPAEYPTRLEAGTLNGHGIAGLGAAAKFISETGVENIHAKERSLMLRFYEGVKNIEGVTVYGDFTKDKTAIVALNIRDYESGEVSYELSQGYGIATRPGAHCAPRMHKALGTAEVGAVRFSFSFYNTEEEIDEAVRAVAELAK